MEFCFETEEFDGFLKKLYRHGDLHFLGDTVTHSWGQRVVRFYNLDDHLIKVGEATLTVIRRFLASSITMAKVAAKMADSASAVEELLG